MEASGPNPRKPSGRRVFAGGRRWLGRCSPRWRNADLTALAPTKISPRRPPLSTLKQALRIRVCRERIARNYSLPRCSCHIGPSIWSPRLTMECTSPWRHTAADHRSCKAGWLGDSLGGGSTGAGRMCGLNQISQGALHPGDAQCRTRGLPC